MMKLMYSTNIEKWKNNVLRIGSLDLVNTKCSQPYGIYVNEYFYWITFGKFKIRWWRQ